MMGDETLGLLPEAHSIRRQAERLSDLDRDLQRFLDDIKQPPAAGSQAEESSRIWTASPVGRFFWPVAKAIEQSSRVEVSRCRDGLTLGSKAAYGTPIYISARAVYCQQQSTKFDSPSNNGPRPPNEMPRSNIGWSCMGLGEYEWDRR